MTRLVHDRPLALSARTGRSVGPPRAAPCNAGPADGVRPEICLRAPTWRSVHRAARAASSALVGGAEWTPGCEEIDRQLLEASGDQRCRCPAHRRGVLAPGQGDRTAASYFAGLGASVKACMVLRRGDAEERENAGTVRAARFLYLAGGSVLHLRSVLKSSPVWDALVEAWGAGAVLAGSSAGAHGAR